MGFLLRLLLLALLLGLAWRGVRALLADRKQRNEPPPALEVMRRCTRCGRLIPESSQNASGDCGNQCGR
jgi:hypothetical protein